MNQINYDNNRIRDSTYGIAIMLSNMYFAADDPMRKEIQGDYMMKVNKRRNKNGCELIQ